MKSNVSELAPVNNSDVQETIRLTVNSYEAAASLRVLIYFAKSSGSLTPNERTVLEEVWDKFTLPPGMTLAGLLEEKVDLDKQLALITSEEARDRTYNAAYGLAHADGQCTPEQQALLGRIRAGLKIPEIKSTPLGRVYWEAREMVFPTTGNVVNDPVVRNERVRSEIMKFSLLNAVTGAFPLPILSIATDLIVVSTQTLMVRDIGQYWGHTVDRQAARSLMGSIVGATGMRIAVHTLLNIVPILGSAVGAASAFVTTYALGQVANRYFESGGKLDADAMRDLYKQALDEANAAYDKSKAVITTRMQSRAVTLELLNEELKSGKISAEEYDRKIAGLH